MTRKQQIGYALIVISLLTLVVLVINKFIQPILPTKTNNYIMLIFASLAGVLGILAAFKDTLELIHILSDKKQQPIEQVQPVFQTNFHKNVKADVIVTGGQNVTVYAGNQQEPINNQIAYSTSYDEQLKLFEKLMGENVRQSLFWKQRLEAYSKTWRSLQVLRIAGDALWETASEENILIFANTLRSTKEKIDEDAIFFEKKDFQKLKIIIDIFNNFQIGKRRLYEIRTNGDLGREYDAIREIQWQINENFKNKTNYENLLMKIMDSFRKRLSR